MTDFYKKLYGYEDDIQLKDDDIKLLESGMALSKMKANKEQFNQRFYRLDLNNYQLIASTRELRKKEKIYSLIRINEVKAGCSSDNLKAYKLKKSIADKKKVEDMENLAFVIVLDNYKKTLDLMAPTETDRNRWVRVLGYFVVLTKKRKGVLPETDVIMRNYFTIADTSQDRKVNANEMTAFLDSINIKLKKDQLKKLIKISDTNHDGELNEAEFESFIQQIYQRKEIISLFKLIITDGAKSVINYVPEFMTVDKFQDFLEKYQKEYLSEQECKELILKYEPGDCRDEFKFSLYGFLNYMNDLPQHIHTPQREEFVYQDMHRPFSHYFINSSHNTYLGGDQFSSEPRPDACVATLMKGARLIELDCHDGSDGQPKIYHKNTLQTRVPFEDFMQPIKEYAFKTTGLPLIITLELACSLPQQRVLAHIIKKHLSEHLFTGDYKVSYPTLRELNRKIIIRCGKLKKLEASEIGNIMKEATSGGSKLQRANTADSMDSKTRSENADNDDVDEESFQPFPELGEIVNLIRNASFRSIDHYFENYDQSNSSSLTEEKARKLVESESASRLIHFLSNYLIKIYPSGIRQDSSNLNPLSFWIYGFQIAALNFQTYDHPMHLNEALFNDNGGCGYVLKPAFLLDPSSGFDPLDKSTMPNKKLLEIKVISAQQLPKPDDLLDDISDPYVVVGIHGVPVDNQEKKTKAIKNNGLNPIWNEDFRFEVNCPELAFVKFTVKDDNFGKNDSVGHYTIRFENIRLGYRHFKLKNKKSKGTVFVGVKISSI